MCHEDFLLNYLLHLYQICEIYISTYTSNCEGCEYVILWSQIVLFLEILYRFHGSMMSLKMYFPGKKYTILKRTHIINGYYRNIHGF